MARKKRDAWGDEIVARGPRGESDVDAEQRRLLAEVLEKPDDDAPRLVYADFLQERGDPRGEFIALQIAGKDEDSASALLKKHKAKWVGRFAGTKTRYGTKGQFTKGSPTSWDFERGFVDKVAMKTVDLVANSKELFEQEPVREIRITDRDVKTLVKKCAGLERLRSLDLAKIVLREDDAQALFGSDRFESLESLDLSGGRVSLKAWRAGMKKFDPKRFPRLRRLDLSGHDLGNAVVPELVSSGLWGILRELDLCSRRMEASAIEILAAAPSRMEILRVAANPIGVEGTRAIVSSKLALRELDVSYVTDGPNGALEALANRNVMPSLVKLEVDMDTPTDLQERLRARFGDGLVVG